MSKVKRFFGLTFWQDRNGGYRYDFAEGTSLLYYPETDNWVLVGLGFEHPESERILMFWLMDRHRQFLKGKP